MLSDKILCAKAFDAAGEIGGSHSASGATARPKCGSNFWADSNLRAWLNSSDGAGSVVWPCGNPPITEKMKYQYPGYADEAGFLSNFSMEEKSVMKTVSQKSILSTYDKLESNLGSEIYVNSTSITEKSNYTNAYSHRVIETVFLLDIMQIRNVFDFNSNYTSCAFTSEAYNYLKSIGYSLGAEGAAYNYWIRTPSVKGNSSVRYITSTESNKNSYYDAYNDACGVRPAFFMDLDNSVCVSGTGTETDPYIVNNIGEIAMKGNSVTYGYTEEEDRTISATPPTPRSDIEYRYQWYESPDGLTTGGIKIDGATNATYEVPTGKNAGKHYYYCEVSANEIGDTQKITKVSDTVVFNVNYMKIPQVKISLEQPLAGMVPPKAVVVDEADPNYTAKRVYW